MESVINLIPVTKHMRDNVNFPLSLKKLSTPESRQEIRILTRKATGFKSVQLTCWEITEVTYKCQVSTSLSKILY